MCSTQTPPFAPPLKYPSPSPQSHLHHPSTMKDHPKHIKNSSSSSSDFEFSITLSPSSHNSNTQLCPADELFYKGQLLPLHISPRLSLVRSLLLSSSSSSSSDVTTSRDSNGSSSSAVYSEESSCPSSVTEEDNSATKRSKFFSFLLNRGSKKNPSFKAKEIIKKYVEKVKPLYEKISSLQKKKTFSFRRSGRTEILSHSFARSAVRKKSPASCPTSMRSSPSHSGVLSSELMSLTASSSSSMEELQGAIQAAIAHCKSSMVKQKNNMGIVVSVKDDICVF